jgi:inosose dehydratase
MNELETRDQHSHEQREHRVSRRELLGRMAAGVAAWICTAERSRAQSDGNAAAWARKVKIGLHQAGWGTRPLRELFTAARELGYDGVELAPPWLEKKHDMEKVYRLLVAAGTGLAPAAYVGGHELRNPAAREAYLVKARKNARWIKAHGGRYVTYGTVSGAGARRTVMERKIIAEAFDRVADVALSEGCTPLYHNHYVKSCRESKLLLQEDMELLEWSRWRLCVDTGHLVLALTEPGGFVTEWVDKISWMHCKDVKTAGASELERPATRWQDHFTPLGTGVVDFPKILETLAGRGFAGWLVVEQDNSTDPYETSKVSIAYLRGVLDAM